MSMRFTERAQRVIILAQEDSKRWQHGVVEPLHLLAALVGLGEGTACKILAHKGLSRALIEEQAMKTIAADSRRLLLGEIPFTPDAKKVLERSVEEAQKMGHSYVGTEHLLLGLCHLESAAKLLRERGLTLEDTRKEVLELVGEGHLPLPQSPEPVKTTYLGQQLLVISMAPEVGGILLSPGTSEVPTIIILLKEGTTPDAAYMSLASVLPAVDRLRFKEPGKVPVSWSNGEWKEDQEFGATLTF